MKLPWWEWLPFGSWRVVGSVSGADEIPERLPKRAIVLVADGERAKWASFDCPCGSGHRVLLNLDLQRRPSWRLTLGRRGTPTLFPSVDFHEGRRRCHFHLTEGKVHWAKDTIR